MCTISCTVQVYCSAEVYIRSSTPKVYRITPATPMHTTQRLEKIVQENGQLYLNVYYLVAISTKLGAWENLMSYCNLRLGD